MATDGDRFSQRSGYAARDIAVASDIAELKAALPGILSAVSATNELLRSHITEQRQENAETKAAMGSRFDKVEAKQLVLDSRVAALELLHVKEDAVRAKDAARAGLAHKIFGGAITGGIMAAGAFIWHVIEMAVQGPRSPVVALAIGVALLSSTGADAATYYVACGTGSNAAAGTSAAPWATITYASSRVAAGDTVIVKPGTCVESVRTQASGQPASPITYRAETRGAAKIVPPANNSSEVAWEQSGSNVVVDGFEVDGSAHQSGTRWKRGIVVLGQQVTVSGNVVHDIGRQAACTDAGYGIGAPETAAYVTIHANTVRAVGNATANCDEEGQPPVELTLRKTWIGSAFDYDYYSPAGSAFSVGQNPWGAWDLGPGDVFTTTALDAPNGFLRMRTVTGPMRFGDGLPKGAPNVTFNDHFDVRSSVRPFGNGVWSNTISELKVSVGGEGSATGANYPCVTPCTAGYARAIQIHGFRTAYTGSAWTEVSSTDGDTYDIQVRYGTFGDYGRYSDWNTPKERRQIGDHTWDIFEVEGGWNSDLGIGFELVGNQQNISNVDMKGILDYALANGNARYNRNDSAIYVRGVQVWFEPRVGTADATVDGMVVKYNGTTYGQAVDQ